MTQSASPGLPPISRGSGSILGLSCVLAIVIYILRLGFATASAEFRQPLHLNDQDMGDLMAAFLLAYGLMEMPWGVLADRLGARATLIWIVLGSSLLTASRLGAIGWMPPASGLMVLVLAANRFLFGSFQAGTFPSITRLVSDYLPADQRGRAQGAVWTASRFGGAAAPLVMVQLIHLCGDWKLPMLIAGLLGLAWLGWFMTWSRCQRVHATATHGPARPRREWADWVSLARNRSAVALCLSYGCLGFSGNFFVTLLPSFLRTQRGLDAQTASLLTSLPFIFGMAACLGGGFLSDWLVSRGGGRGGRRLVGMAGLTCAAVAIMALPWARSTPALAILLVLTFAGNDLAMAPAWASASDIDLRKAGALSGAMNMASSILAALETRTVGRMFKAGDCISPFILLGTAYLLGAAAWIAVTPRHPADAP